MSTQHAAHFIAALSPTRDRMHTAYIKGAELVWHPFSSDCDQMSARQVKLMPVLRNNSRSLPLHAT